MIEKKYRRGQNAHLEFSLSWSLPLLAIVSIGIGASVQLPWVVLAAFLAGWIGSHLNTVMHTEPKASLAFPLVTLLGWSAGAVGRAIVHPIPLFGAENGWTIATAIGIAFVVPTLAVLCYGERHRRRRKG